MKNKLNDIELFLSRFGERMSMGGVKLSNDIRLGILSHEERGFVISSFSLKKFRTVDVESYLDSLNDEEKNLFRHNMHYFA